MPFQEHQILKEEKSLLSEFERLEKRERECFSLLSAAVRDSHEKERAQAEKTKYWSVLGSIIVSVDLFERCFVVLFDHLYVR